MTYFIDIIKNWIAESATKKELVTFAEMLDDKIKSYDVRLASKAINFYKTLHKGTHIERYMVTLKFIKDESNMTLKESKSFFDEHVREKLNELQAIEKTLI